VGVGKKHRRIMITREPADSPRAAWGTRIENWFFTERRIGSCALGWALGYTIILPGRLSRPEWWLNPDGKGCTDFIWIWLTGKLALSGSIVQAYDSSAFSAAREAFLGSPECVLGHLNYPPTLLFFTYPLGLFPYSVALAVWITSTLLLYLAAIYAPTPGRRDRRSHPVPRLF